VTETTSHMKCKSLASSRAGWALSSPRRFSDNIAAITMLELTSTWKSTYPQARVGVLVMRSVANPAHHPNLESRKELLERQLRTQFAGQDRAALASHPVLQAYAAYYRRFKKTYHIQLQLESILWKRKSIPGGAGLVEAMFMAEMQDLLLTAGHDLDALHLPLRLDVATGSERYVLLRGEEQTLKAGDMMISDGLGVISSILYGPDQRTQITPGTRNVVFTVYAPPGIDGSTVGLHLQHIREHIMLFSPDSQVESLDICEGE
jgi:DNA/RNA-binding domain of Phe-tRNA-synthetase-like protein